MKEQEKPEKTTSISFRDQTRKSSVLVASSLSSSQNGISNQKSFARDKIRKTTIRKKEFDTNPEFIECKFCKLKVNLLGLFTHLENTCEMFRTFPIKTQRSKEEKTRVSKLNFNSAVTPLTETVEAEFQAKEIQDHLNLTLATHQKEKKTTRHLIPIKDIEIPNLAVGEIHLKSNQFCVFGLIVKNRYLRYHVAYRAEENNIDVLDLGDYTICATLKGHKDLVSEIRYIKTKKDYNLLLTSSYDGNLFIWEVSTFNLVRRIVSNSWVLSSTIANHNDQEIVFLTGGYCKNSPILAFDLESGDKLYEITLKEEAIPIIIEKHQMHKFHYLFVGTDNENPKFIIIDYNIKQIIKILNLKCAVSSICISSTSNSQIFAYTSDYYGNITEFDVTKAKLNTEFSAGANCLDLLIYDDFYLISCGDKDNSMKSIIRHKHRVGKSFSHLHEKVILNIQKINFVGHGNCIFTLSADKKIKIFKY